VVCCKNFCVGSLPRGSCGKLTAERLRSSLGGRALNGAGAAQVAEVRRAYGVVRGAATSTPSSAAVRRPRCDAAASGGAGAARVRAAVAASRRHLGRGGRGGGRVGAAPRRPGTAMACRARSARERPGAAHLLLHEAQVAPQLVHLLRQSRVLAQQPRVVQRARVRLLGQLAAQAVQAAAGERRGGVPSANSPRACLRTPLLPPAALGSRALLTCARGTGAGGRAPPAGPPRPRPQGRCGSTLAQPPPGLVAPGPHSRPRCRAPPPSTEDPSRGEDAAAAAAAAGSPPPALPRPRPRCPRRRGCTRW